MSLDGLSINLATLREQWEEDAAKEAAAREAGARH
jgi:hypothetical protein